MVFNKPLWIYTLKIYTNYNQNISLLGDEWSQNIYNYVGCLQNTRNLIKLLQQENILGMIFWTISKNKTKHQTNPQKVHDSEGKLQKMS